MSNNQKSRPQKQNYASNRNRKQPRKDSRSKRVNYDNERVSKAEADEMRGRSGYTDARSNDVVWYAQNAELLRSAASLPFSTTTGLPIGLDNDPNDKHTQTVPGVMALEWAPSIGGTFDDAINAAANQYYSYVVHKNSRNKSYDSPDLMIMTLCGASVLSFLANGIRAYGVMKTFDQRNRYLPKALVKAMGFDYDDLRDHLSQMWFDLNELIARVSQIWLPKNLPFIQRWFWMNTNIYIDAESIKGQYYLFAPFYILQYNEKGDYFSQDHVAEAQLLQWHDWEKTPDGKPTGKQLDATWDKYMSVINNMISALVDSQDRGTIYGDILKAYGEENLVSIAPITTDYTVVPVYDREVLTQIENATFVGNLGMDVVAFSQDPDTNRIYTRGDINTVYSGVFPTVDGNGICNGLPSKQILNFHQVDTPTPEQIMVATRLKAAGMGFIWNGQAGTTYGSDKYSNIAPQTCGTEVLEYCKIYQYLDNDVMMYNVTSSTHATGWNSVLDNTDAKIWMWNAFDWAPWLYNVKYYAPWTASTRQQAILATDAAKGYDKVTGALGDYDYYTVVDVNELKKMHQTALYSEFGVPVL